MVRYGYVGGVVVVEREMEKRGRVWFVDEKTRQREIESRRASASAAVSG